jgi:hypothetical protein
VHPSTNAPRLAPSLQVPGAFPEDPDEAGGVTMEEGGALAQLENLDNTELAFAGKTADADAPDTHTLAEAMCSPDQPPIEEKPVTCKVRPVAHGHRIMGGIDHVDTHVKVVRVAANPGHIYWEAVKRTLRYFSGTPNPPSTRVETSSPLEGHSDAASFIAKDRRTISERVFPIDGGITTPKSLKWQDNALSPTTVSGAWWQAGVMALQPQVQPRHFRQPQLWPTSLHRWMCQHDAC